MNRYIDADKLIDKYERAIEDEWNKKTSPSSWADAYDCVIADIDDVPTADVAEVRHGRWINNHCTVCGMTPIGDEAWTRLGLTPPRFELCMSFCPCCGAKMDGERSENGS